MLVGWNSETYLPRYGADSKIRGESESLADFVVAGVLELDLVRRLEPLGVLKDDIASLGEGFYGFRKGFRHERRREHPALDRPLHRRKDITYMTYKQGGGTSSTGAEAPVASTPSIFVISLLLRFIPL